MKKANNQNTNSIPGWIEIIKKYNKPNISKSILQLFTSVVPYIILWVLMVISIKYSYWITLGLSVIASGFLVRTFIVFHDCVHGSFFKKRKHNTIAGFILGLFAFTPFHRWQNDHIIHHSTVGNLDKRGIGDVKTLTVQEYLNRSKWGRFRYRVYRHPIFLFGIAPLLQFALQYRLPLKRHSKSVKIQTHITNVILVAIVTGLIFLLGWKTYLLIQLPVLYIATSNGIWLFYVQHQFENVIWAEEKNWDYKTMALEGSSYFKLPILLQWFTGNIGFHHIHHLSPIIPNYNLPKCHKENKLFQQVKPITFFSALKTLKLRLWDEQRQRLIDFKQIKTNRRFSVVKQ